MSHRLHGTHAKYVVDRCRCGECRRATSEYERERRRRTAPTLVSATPAREHVMFLKSQGVGLKTIGRSAGVPHGSMSKLIYGDPVRGMGPSKRIRPETSEKILAVAPTAVAPGGRVDAGPTWEIIERLVAAGMPKAEISRRIGGGADALQLSRSLVRADHARAVAVLDAEFKAGTLTFVRRHRHSERVETIGAPPVDSTPTDVRRSHDRAKTQRHRALAAGLEPAIGPPVHDDADQFILDMVEVFEARIDEAAWRARSACKGKPARLWFPAADDTQSIAAARKVCASCPVAGDCLEANRDRPDGIFAGLTADERLQVAA